MDSVTSEMLDYVFRLAIKVIKIKSFRVEVLSVILSCFEGKDKSFADYDYMTRIYVLLNRSEDAIKLLLDLVKTKEKRKILLAY